MMRPNGFYHIKLCKCFQQPIHQLKNTLKIMEFHSDGLDRSTVRGFFMKFLLQIHAGYSYFLTMLCVSTFFAGCCYYIQACCMEFKQIFEKMDEAIATVNKDGIDRMAFNIKRAIILHIKIMK